MEYIKIYIPSFYPDGDQIILFYDKKKKIYTDLGETIQWIKNLGKEIELNEILNFCNKNNVQFQNGEIVSFDKTNLVKTIQEISLYFYR